MGLADRDIAQAPGLISPPGYSRHRPETTLFYRLVAEHYPKFRDRRAAEERPLPRCVADEFEAYLRCGRLEHGFLRVRCESCQAEKLVTFSCKRRGFCPSCGARQMAETEASICRQQFGFNRPRRLRRWHTGPGCELSPGGFELSLRQWTWTSALTTDGKNVSLRVTH